MLVIARCGEFASKLSTRTQVTDSPRPSSRFWKQTDGRAVVDAQSVMVSAWVRARNETLPPERVVPR